MTNKEALQAELQNVVVTDEALQKALLDNDVNDAATYSKDNARNIAVCTVQVLQSLLATQDIQEGGMSISMRSTTIPAQIQYLARKWNMIDVLRAMTPTIQAVSRW